MKCKHCGREILGDGDRWAHVYGPGSVIIRCRTAESGKPYGLTAEPEDDQ